MSSGRKRSAGGGLIMDKGIFTGGEGGRVRGDDKEDCERIGLDDIRRDLEEELDHESDGEDVDDENGKKGEECWGCEWGFGRPVDLKKNIEMDSLWSAFMKMNGKVANNYMYRMLSRLQKHYFFDKKQREGVKCILWSPKQVKQHLNHHMYYYEFHSRQDIKLLERVQYVVIENIAEKNLITNKIMLDKDKIDSVIKLIEKKHTLIARKNPQFMNGGGGVIKTIN